MDEKILAEVKDNYNAFKQASPELQKDEAFVKKAILNNHVVLKLADTFRGNREFVKDIINTQPNALQFASEELKNDPELTGIQKAAFKKKWESEAEEKAAAKAEMDKFRAAYNATPYYPSSTFTLPTPTYVPKHTDTEASRSAAVTAYLNRGGRTRRKRRRKTKLKRTRIVRKVKR